MPFELLEVNSKRVTPSLLRSGMQLCGWEGNSPELGSAIILFDKLNAIGAKSFHSADLAHNPGSDLNAALVPKRDSGPDRQFPMDLNGSPVLVQVRRFDISSECGLVAILATEPHRCVQ